MTDARSGHRANRLDSGAVLISGGSSGSKALSSTELFVFEEGGDGVTASVGPPMLEAHLAHTATTLSDGRVLVAGGSDTGGSESKSAEIYDPAANNWTAVAPMATARIRHTATLLSDGRVLVVGSFQSETVEIYDPASDTWTEATPMADARYNHSATLLASGQALVVGGYNMNENKIARVEVYDPSTDTWSTAAPLEPAREEHTATWLDFAGGVVAVVGGRGPSGNIANVDYFLGL